MTSITIDCGTGNNGNGNSTYNTPQAKDDAYADGENTIATLNVMSNDLGGNAKTLYSVDQSNPAVVQTVATSDMGASIKIVNGQIVYDPTGSAAIQALSQGQTAVDSFSYTIRLANGTLSVATVKVTITGANDAPILSADTSGPHTLIEHAGATGSTALDTSSATLNFADVDLLDTHTVSVGAATAVWSGGSTLPSGLQALLNGAVKTTEYDSNILTQTQAAASAATSGILGAIGSVLSGGSVSAAAGQAGSALSTAASLYHPGTGSVGLAFSAADSAFDFLAAGETLKITYNVTVTDNHGASSTQPVTFTITGSNDAPVVSADAVANHALTERATTTGSASADTATATLTFTDADLSDTHTVSIGAAAVAWSGGSALPTGLQATLNAALKGAVNDSTHVGTGSVGLTFSPADSAFDFLAAGETLKVTYTVTVTDNNGAASTQAVAFTVTGANDAPVLSADRVAIHGMSEQAGVTGGSGADSASTTLNFSDVDLSDTHTVSVSNATAVWSDGSTLPVGLQSVLNGALATTLHDSTHAGSGSVGVSFSAADGAFDFLGAGETLRVAYNVTVTDSQGVASTRTVMFVVTGTNDGPALAADASGAHAMTEIAGVTNGPGVESASTTLAFTDLDLNDSHGVIVAHTGTVWSGGANLPAGLSAMLDSAAQGAVADSTGSSSGAVKVAFSAADHAFDFLAAGETLTVTYNVTVIDTWGAASTQPVTFTVTGTNDAPVLAAGATAAFAEQAGLTHASAADFAAAFVAFTDTDLTDTHTTAISAATASWSGGSTLPAGLQAILDGAVATHLTDSTQFGFGTVRVDFGAADNAFDFLGAGETLTVSYNLTVTDAQGASSTQPVTFIVTGTNDAPVLAAQAAVQDTMGEVAGVTASAAMDGASAALAFTDVDLNDTHAVSLSAATAVWSAGSALPSGLQAVLDHAAQASVADSTGSGSGAVFVQFAAADNAFDFLAAGETLTVTYKVTVTDAQGASSTQPMSFLITGTNDAPVLAADTGANAITELAGATGSAAADGAATTLAFADADLNDTHAVSVSGASAVWTGGSALPAGLQAVLDGAVTTSLTDSTHSGSGSVGVAFSAADGAFDFLAAGETLTVTYNVTVTDTQGATSSQAVTFTVTGTNDAPVLAADAGVHAIAEQAGLTGSAAQDVASTTLAFADADLNDTHSIGVSGAAATWSGGAGLPAGLQALLDNALHVGGGADSTNTGSGTVTLNFSAADGAFDFLSAGETLTVTYNVMVSDSQGATSAQPVTFVVTGTNDAPILAADTGAHAITEQAGVTGSSASDIAQAVLSFTDVDLNDTHGVTISGPTASLAGGGALPAGFPALLGGAIQANVGADSTHGAAGQVTVSFGAPDAAFDFLAAGQVLTVTYNISVVDTQGATSTRPVTFTVTGANDGPVLAADTGAHALTEIAGVTHGAGVDTASTVLGFTDADLTDIHTASYSLASSSWSGGTIPTATLAPLSAGLSLAKVDNGGAGTGQVTATFSVADKQFDFLAAGETLNVTYNVTIDDGHGATSVQPVTFTVTGTNDAPVLAAAPSSPQTAETFTFESNEAWTNTYNNAGYYTVTDRDFTFAGVEGYSYSSAYGNPGAMAYTYNHTPVVNGAMTDWHRTDGKEFSLQAFDVSGYNYSAGSFTVTIKGYDHGTLVATKTVTVAMTGNYAASYQTVALDSTWTTLDDVQLTFTGMPSDVFFDNIKVGPPVAGGGAVNLAETSGVTGSNAALAGSTTLTFTDVDLNDHHTASVATPTAVWSGGSALPSGLIAALTGALGANVIDSTGTGAGSLKADFSTQDHTFDFLAAGETLTVTYNVTVDDGHGGASTQPVTITVTGTNDAPVLVADAGAGAHAAAESGASTQAATSSLAFTDADLNDSHTASTGFLSATWSTGGTIPTASLTAIQSALSASVAETHGTGAGQVNLNFALADGAMSFLAAGETITATYNVTVNDGHGATSTQPVTYTITGVNSAPVLTVSNTNLVTNGDFEHGATGWSNTGSGGAVEVNGAGVYGVGGFSGNVLEIDANGGLPVDDVSQVVTVPGGSYTLSFDTADRSGSSASTNTFNVYWNGQLIDTVTPASTTSEHHSYTVTGAGPTGKLEFVEINSDGLGGIVDNVSLVATNTTALTEQTNATGSTTLDSGSYAFKLTDANYTDTHTLSVSGASAAWSGGAISAATQSVLDHAVTSVLTDTSTGSAGSVALAFAAQDHAFDFLAAGETLTATYNVAVADNHGGTTAQPVTFTITGTNDAVINTTAAGGAAGTFNEAAATSGSSAISQASGAIGFTDADLTDAHIVNTTVTPILSWSGGTLSDSQIQALQNAGSMVFNETDSTGSGSGSVGWHYQIADGALDFLAAGETLTVTYNVQVSDAHGSSITQAVTVTMNGVADAPVLTVAAATGLAGAAIPVTLSAATVDANSAISALTLSGLPSGLTLSDGAGHSFTATSSATSVDVHAWNLTTLTATGSSAVAGTVNLGVAATALDANGATATTNGVLALYVDHPPVAVADSYTINTGSLTTLNPVNNDTDPDGNALTILGLGAAAHGTVSLNQDGTVSYQSTAGYVGADSFTYTVGDGHGGAATGTVALTVQVPEQAVAPTLTVGSNTVIVPTDGSAMKTTLSLHAGDVVSFQWNFTTDDYLPFKDFAFATVNGVSHLLSDIQSTGSYGATGWQTFTFTAAATGTYVIGQGVMNDQDQSVQSYLTVDNMKVNGAVVQSFESGFGATQTSGQVSVVTSAASSQNPSALLNPTNGTHEALLVSQPTSESALETFLGLTQGSLVHIAQSTGAEYTPIILPIGVAVPGNAHPDDTYVTISGAPAGSVLNHGVYDATHNTWTVDASDLGGNLTITTPSDYAGTFTLSVTATSVVEGSNTSATTAAQTQVVTVAAASVALTGGAGGGTMIGGTLADTLTSGSGADIMTGGGGSDAFVFNAAAFGHDTVNDFTAGTDYLQINHTVFADAATALSHAAQVGNDVVITYDAADTITLKGVLLTNLHATDFHIV